MKVLRTDLGNNSTNYEPIPEEWRHLGGRALISKIMTEEVEPVCDPLGPKNKLIIAPGILAGTTASCVNRISIGGKSPLTGTIKESNAGGNTAYKLARLGIKTVILEGIPKENKLKILFISDNKVKLFPAEELKELGVYETAEKLRNRFGKKIGMIINGQGGERLYRSAGIANTDNEGTPSRFSGRGGLGAVMGSKGIKAVVIDDSNAKGIIIQDEDLFKKTRSIITHTIINNEQIANSYTKFGTAGLVALTNSIGALPTRNFSNGSFEGSEKINGQRLYDLIKERKGKTSHACMPGCLIRCSNIFPDEQGKPLVSPLEYETIGLLGSNCGIDNLDIIGKLNYLCNDIGIDTIEIGGAIGVAMEAGIIEFGDEEGTINLLNEVKNDTYLGKIIAAGASITGKILGVKRVPVSKDQTIAAYDPRAIKGLGVTYATSTMGADHTAGQTLRSPVEHTKTELQVETSKKAQIANTIHDCIGTCIFVGGAIMGNLQLLADLYTSMSGESWTVEDFMKMSKETLLRERKFNEDAGITIAHDRLAEFFYYEENPVTKTVFDVDEEEMKTIHDFEEVVLG